MVDIPDYMRGFDLDEDYGFTPVQAKPKTETSVDKKVVENEEIYAARRLEVMFKLAKDI